MNADRKNRGTSLVETLIYGAVLSLAFSTVCGILIAGMSSFHLGADAVDIQEQALRGVTALERGLRESNFISTQVNGSGESKGVIFISPRNLQNQFDYDAGEGCLFWNKLVCMYVAPHPVTGIPALIRKEVAISRTSLNVPIAELTATHQSVTAFVSDAALKPRYVAGCLDDLRCSFAKDEVNQQIHVALAFRKNGQNAAHRIMLDLRNQSFPGILGIRTRNGR
ncbi:MAG: hypothetical protein HYU64_07480 [Armatimonadetes bacterium]|nr:hypothetical protein [Armatimonadota bacterium]